ncbi:hypothetical protein AB0J83_27705 [Actinoplanes sp. NPDC049596]|uniref:hypothetical protein n=1 Tax=unclassified Actinoplanes TaxID=2626549 RepID=UPI00343C205B
MVITSVRPAWLLRVAVVLVTLLGGIGIAVTPARAASVGHACEEVYSEPSPSRTTRHEAVQCIDIDAFVNSSGRDAVRGLGSSYCQLPNGSLLACKGLKMTVTVYDWDNDAVGTTTHTCGSYGGSACPSGGRRFGYSPGIYCYSDHEYSVRVETEFKMPSGNIYAGETETSIGLLGTVAC